MGKMILNGKEYAGSGSEWHEYSTEEKVVGKWIDGKPLYEKTVIYAGGTTGQISVNHGVVNLKRIIEIAASVRDSDGTGETTYPLPRISSDGYNIGIMGTGSSTITYYVPSVFGNRIVDCIFTIRYTKTTD